MVGQGKGSRVLGINAIFHDPSAALVVGGRIVAAAEEERFTRRKHGKLAVPFSAWELPEKSAAWCLRFGDVRADDLDAVAYSYEPDLVPSDGDDITAHEWEGLRTLYAREAPSFLKTALPGLDPRRVRFVPHHVAHAASAYLAAPMETSSVLVFDGRGEDASHLAGHWDGQRLEVLSVQRLPHSLGLMYEEVTDHLGFMRSSDEYKVMALASYGKPAYIDEFRQAVQVRDDGGFRIDPIRWEDYAPRVGKVEQWDDEHANLAATVQRRLEEVLLELGHWLFARTGDPNLSMAGGVALNCVANSRLAAEGPFERIWVQPAAGDAGTALGAAMLLAARAGDEVEPMPTAALGRGFDDETVGRVHAPAGLDLGHVTHEEIAVAILAELVQFRAAGRLKAEATVAAPVRPEAIDPVCGMTVQVAGARHRLERGGQTFYFCCPGCLTSFQASQEETGHGNPSGERVHSSVVHG